MKRNEVFVVSAVMFVLVVFRIIMPEANFNPMGAIALMGAFLFKNRILAFALPFAALFISDIVLATQTAANFEYLFSVSFFFVYAAFALIIGIGILLAKKPSLVNTFGSSLLAAGIFFLVSNFGSWLFFEMYPKNLEGLAACMNAGIPFFRATLISQIVFSVGIYLVYSFATNRKLAIA